ncbi:hypothetical protein D3C76_1675840 [compost metagenome]
MAPRMSMVFANHPIPFGLSILLGAGGFALLKSAWQCLQRIASALMVSAQKGHFLSDESKSRPPFHDAVILSFWSSAITQA